MIRFAFASALLSVALMSPAPAPATEIPPVRLAQAGGIDVPSTVDPGASVTVRLSGASAGGRVELWGPVTQSGRGASLGSVPADGATVSFAAPTQPGSYELRHVGPNGAVRARKTLDVAAVPVRLSVPRQLAAGLESRVVWHGPADAGDMLRLVDPASGAVVAEAPATGTAGAENVTMLRAPETQGDYQLQYWSGARHSALRSLPVSVVRGSAWLRTPVQVGSGASFTVDWHGPVSEGHAFRIVDPATQTVIQSRPGAESATLTAPTRTGRYRVQYVDADSGHVFSDLPLRVSRR